MSPERQEKARRRILEWANLTPEQRVEKAKELLGQGKRIGIYAGAGKVLQTARGAMYCIAQRAERADRERLGLPSGEQAGAVDTGQNAHLGGQRTDLVLLAAVHTVSLQQPRLDDLLSHRRLERGFDLLSMPAIEAAMRQG